MADTDIYQQFLDKLKKDKSPEDAGKFLANLLKFSAAEVYFALMTYLTDEDMECIEKIADEKKAEEEMISRFKLRTGVTPVEFVTHLRDEIGKNYLSPQLDANANTK